MNVIQEIQRINQAEIEQNLINTPASWHAKYANSAWVYMGGLPTQLTEGDILAIMSQFGEIEDINLVREEKTGKSRGFCFVKYEDCRSCVLAVDNFNGSMVLGKSLRVDHVENYRLPKHLREKDGDDGESGDEEGGGVNQRIDADGDLKAGHAYHGKELKNQFNIHQGIDLFAPVQNDVPESLSNRKIPAYVPGGEDEEQQLEEKLKRKAERDSIRRDRELRRQEKEEKRRKKRADKYEGVDDNGDGSGDKESSQRATKRELKYKRKHKRNVDERPKYRRMHDRSRSKNEDEQS